MLELLMPDEQRRSFMTPPESLPPTSLACGQTDPFAEETGTHRKLIGLGGMPNSGSGLIPEDWRIRATRVMGLRKCGCEGSEA